MSVYTNNIFVLLAEISRVGLDVYQYVIIGKYLIYFEVFFIKNLGGTAENLSSLLLGDEGFFFRLLVLKKSKGEINAKYFS